MLSEYANAPSLETPDQGVSLETLLSFLCHLSDAGRDWGQRGKEEWKETLLTGRLGRN